MILLHSPLFLPLPYLFGFSFFLQSPFFPLPLISHSLPTLPALFPLPLILSPHCLLSFPFPLIPPPPPPLPPSLSPFLSLSSHSHPLPLSRHPTLVAICAHEAISLVVVWSAALGTVHGDEVGVGAQAMTMRIRIGEKPTLYQADK